jgi:hypothetical protein
MQKDNHPPKGIVLTVGGGGGAGSGGVSALDGTLENYLNSPGGMGKSFTSINDEKYSPGGEGASPAWYGKQGINATIPGGGGGGGGGADKSGADGGNGADGIVIVRFPYKL